MVVGLPITPSTAGFSVASNAHTPARKNLDMRDSYLKYYDRFTYRAVARFTLDAFLAGSKLRRLSLANRQRDYLGLGREPALLPLHRKINEHLLRSAREWDSYDYGEGYFYQSFHRAGVTGLRDTRARVDGMGLLAMLAGKRVLEVGGNSGFLALSVADAVDEIDTFDINPHLIAIGKDVAAHLGVGNVHLEVSTFEEWPSSPAYDVVLSFANHHTYDGNTCQTVEEYFRKCRELIVPGGLMLFESHAPDYEGEGLAGVCKLIADMFTIREQRVLTAGSFLDRGRTYIIAERS